MNELPPRTFAEMTELLDEMNSFLEAAAPTGTRFTLYTVGGIAMAAEFSGRATQDVDVVTATIPKAVQKAARAVAKKHHMPDHWVNNDVADIVDVDLPFNAFQSIYSNRNIEVLGVKPEYLLALKLMSGRDKDIKDLVLLAEKVGATTSSELLAVCDRVYAEQSSYEIERGFVRSVCEDIALLVRSHLSGNNITEEIERLAATYTGRDLEHDKRRHVSPGSAVQGLAPTAPRGTCAARTKTGRRCSHPAPPVGGRCAAGHIRRR